MTPSLNSLVAFKTASDPILRKMRLAAEVMIGDMKAGLPPRWLSFVGPSGTGKTFLADMIRVYAKSIPCVMNHTSLLAGVHRAFWPKLLSRFRDGEYHIMADLADCNFLMLDEVVIEHDPSGFAKDKLSELFSRRVGKWTVVTSNKTLSQLSDIDARIASRMIRGDSVVIGCNTVDWATRNSSKQLREMA